MPKQLDQQRNGRWADLANDFKRLLMQVFIVTGEESSQQGQRVPAALDQRGFSAGADLQVVRNHPIGPVTHMRRVHGNIRGLSEYWNWQNTKQEEQESHGQPGVSSITLLIVQ